MAVEIKSHVLRRDEKGMFGIPFKRLLGAGVGSIMLFTFIKMVLPPALSVLFGLISFILLIVLTATRGGLPLYQRLWLRVKGHLILEGARNPQGLWGELASFLSISTELAMLDGSTLFATHATVEINLTEWEFLSSGVGEDETGLIFIEER